MGNAPTTAQGFTDLFQAKNDLVWSGGDQTTSFHHNGFTYWIFGDTILGTEAADGSYEPGWTMVANTILVQQGDQFSPAMADGSYGIPNPRTHTSANQERYWTQGMFYANQHLYVLCQRVVNNAEGGFNVIGGELAKLKQQTDGTLTLVAMIATPATGKSETPGPYGIQWCSDALRSGSYIYFYGATRAQGNPYVIHYSYVARAPIAHFEDPSKWRFYKKTTNSWVERIEQLDQDVVNQPDAIVASQLSSVRWINGKHVMIHKPWNNWGTDVIVQTSPTPVGPWTVSTVVFTSPAGEFEGVNYETYGPQLHPEQSLASGKTLVSINWNFAAAGDLNTIASNADLYKPRFYEVQF